ncbi:MAG TPA: hypothetical protein VGC27_02615 [Rhizomicrobium sp.]
MSRWIMLGVGIVAAVVLMGTYASYLPNPLNIIAPCENTVVKSVVSPDGRHKAVLFQRNCGATTGFSSQVSIIPASLWLPDHSGNAFVADLPENKSPAA